MKKSKIVLVLAVLLLVSQLFGANLGLLAESKKANGNTNAIVDVKLINHDQSTINWLVTIETS